MGTKGVGPPQGGGGAGKSGKAEHESKVKSEQFSATSDGAKKTNQGIKSFAKKMLSSVKNAKNKLLQKSPTKSVMNPKVDEVLKEFEKEDNYENLKEIDLSGANLEDSSLFNIADAITDKAGEKKNHSPGKFEIDSINLSDNEITGNMAQIIMDGILKQSEKVSLKNLSLNNAKLTDEGAEYIAVGVAEQKKLQVLDLTGNKLSDKGARNVIEKLAGKEGQPVSVKLSVAEDDKEGIKEFVKGMNINVEINPDSSIDKGDQIRRST